MKSRTSVIVMLGLIGAAAVWLGACGEEKGITLGETAYTFSGTITDSVTGLPLDSARISLSDTSMSHPSWYSDSAGYYQGVSFGGNIVIFAHKAGYLTQSRALNLVRDLTDIDFQLVTE